VLTVWLATFRRDARSTPCRVILFAGGAPREVARRLGKGVEVLWIPQPPTEGCFRASDCIQAKPWRPVFHTGQPGFSMITWVPPAGFEPAAHGLGNRCSIP
jgi:hypothetical protein